MAEIQLGMIESRFAQRIWEMEPDRTPELVKMAQEECRNRLFTCKGKKTVFIMSFYIEYLTGDLP